jgi:hypothetical protein
VFDPSAAVTVVSPIDVEGGLLLVGKDTNVTPFIVAGPNGPVLVSPLAKLNALSNVPTVLMSEAPEMVVAGFQVIVAACVCSTKTVRTKVQLRAGLGLSNFERLFFIGTSGFLFFSQ